MALYSTVAWDGRIAADYVPPRGQRLAEQGALREACAAALDKVAPLIGGLGPPTAAPLSVGRLQCRLWSCRSSRVTVQLVTAVEEPLPDAAARGYLAAIMRSLRASFIFGAALPQAEELRRLMKASAELQLLTPLAERSDVPPPKTATTIAPATGESGESIGDRIRSRLLGLKRMMGSPGEEAGAEMGSSALVGLLKRRKMAHDASDQTVPEASTAQKPRERHSSLEDVWKAIAPRLAAMLNSAGEDNAKECRGDMHRDVAGLLQGHRRIAAAPGAFRRLVVNISLLFTGHCRSVKNAMLMQTVTGLQLLDLYLERWGSYLLVAKHMHDLVAMRIFRALEDHEGLDSSPDIFSMAIKAWREHTVGNEVGIEKQLAQAMAAVFESRRWHANERHRIITFIRSLLALSDVAVFDAVVKDVLLESLTAATMESAREFSHVCSEPQQLQRQVAMLVQWHTEWELLETSRLDSLVVHDKSPFDVLGALGAAPFACSNSILGSLDAVYSTMVYRLQATAEAHRRQVATQHLAPLLLNSLDVLMRNNAWEEVSATVATLEGLQQRPALGRTLFGHVRAEGAAIIGRASSLSAEEVVTSLASFVRRFEIGLPSLAVAEGESGLSMLEKMLITVLSLLPAAALRLWEAVREGTESLHADVVSVLRYVQDKDDFERQLATALAFRLAGGCGSSGPAWMRADREAGDLLRLVDRLQDAFGSKLTARLKKMRNDCMLSAHKGGDSNVEEGSDGEGDGEGDDEEEIDDLLVVDDGEDSDTRLQVLLCSQANWPREAISPSTSPKLWSADCPLSTDCHLPEDLQKCWTAFCAQQRQREPHKRTTFLANQGWAEVVLDGKSMWVTTAMMAVLSLLAEEEEPLRFDALLEASRLPTQLLRATLLALCYGLVVATNAALPPHDLEIQALVLRQSISSSHHFSIAWEQLAAAPARIEEVFSVDEAEEDMIAAEEEECVAANRRSELDACIVEILRLEEAVEAASLKQRVVGAMKQAFMPQPATIQERIDALVEQRLLCYDPPDSSVLSITALRKVSAKAHNREGVARDELS